MTLRRQILPLLVTSGFVLAATGCLGSITVYKVGNKPVAAAIVDVNGDGRPDVVVADGGSNTVTVRLQGRHGFFDDSYTMKLPKGAAPTAIVAGTFRKNGAPTVVVANGGDDSLSIFERFAPGATPTKTISLGPGSRPAALAVGDADGDGDRDLFATSRQPTFPGCQTKGCVLVFRDKGDGLAYSYQAHPVGTDERVDYNPVSLSVGELWGEGRPELAVVNRGTSEAVLIETRGGGFEAAAAYTTVDVAAPTTVEIGVVSTARMVLVAGSTGQGKVFVVRGREKLQSIGRVAKLGASNGQLFLLDPDSGRADVGGQHYTSPMLIGATRIAQGRLDGDKLVDAAVVRAGSDSITVVTTSQQWSSPLSLDLGTVAVGSTSERRVEAKARVVDDWVYTPRLAGPDAASFRVKGCGKIDKPGGSCTFTVTFAPTSPGVKRATIQIDDVNAYRTDNTAAIAWGKPQIAVTGTATAAAPTAPTGPSGSLAVGVADDHGKYAGDGGATFFSTLSSLGMSENRMAVLWQPGQLAPSDADAGFLDRSIAQAQRAGIRVVLALYPAAARQHDPEQFCAYARAVAQRWPYVKEIVVGNEPNKADFWSPVDPAAYTRVLARCYDELHPLGVTVAGGALSARKVGSGMSPVEFLAGMGAAYRSLGRQAPLLDLLSLHPYPNPERLGRGVEAGYEWPNAGIPDLDRIKQVVEDAFAGTAQPTFASTLRLKLDEVGWQASIPAEYAGFYRGAENSPTVDEARQAEYYASLVSRVACDPHVAGLLLFHLVDEQELATGPTSGGWQSGLLRADLSRRPAFESVRAAIAAGCTGRRRTWTPADGVVGGSVALKATRQQVRIAGKRQPGVKLSIAAAAAEGIAWTLTVKNASGKVVVTRTGKRDAPFDAGSFIAPVLLGSGTYTATMTLTATTNPRRSVSATTSGSSG